MEVKRMAGDYEIFATISIGPEEIVMGENPEAPRDKRYMCAYCTTNELFDEYSGAMASDDYVEILELYAERIREAAEKLREELSRPLQEGIDDRPLTDCGFIPVVPDDDLNGKVIVIRPDVLKREYQRATRQLQLCIGGFGASPRSRGSACYCTNLYSGKESRFERRDVLGIVGAEQMPGWAKDRLAQIEKQRQKDRGDAR